MNEIIEFFKSGGFCKEFGHMMERTAVYDDCAKFTCKFCKVEQWS